LIKVNPGQVNKPGTQRQRKKYGAVSRSGEKEAGGGGREEGEEGTGGAGGERKTRYP